MHRRHMPPPNINRGNIVFREIRELSRTLSAPIVPMEMPEPVPEPIPEPIPPQPEPVPEVEEMNEQEPEIEEIIPEPAPESRIDNIKSEPVVDAEQVADILRGLKEEKDKLFLELEIKKKELMEQTQQQLSDLSEQSKKASSLGVAKSKKPHYTESTASYRSKSAI